MYSDLEPKVAIVLVNWNGGQDTIECLDSVFRSDYSNLKVIVCDNGSTDQSIEQVKSWAQGQSQWEHPQNSVWTNYLQPLGERKVIDYFECSITDEIGQMYFAPEQSNLIILRLSHNHGFGKANNIAIQVVQKAWNPDYVWLLNNDTVIEKESLAKMINLVKAKLGIVGAMLIDYKDPSRIQAYGGGTFNRVTGQVTTEQKDQNRKLDFINGASMLIPRSVIDQVGLFDEHIFMYFEENDYCIRAQKLGIAMVLSGAKIFHKGGSSSGGAGSYFSWRNVYFSKCYVLIKNQGPGSWMLFSILAWAINLVNPNVSPAKRKASKDAIVHLTRLIMN